ncbi:triacylglycerol lipase [Dictyocaulus viviparus]|uniref:Triacylglycerol lipase n=1 Tax=Dictyocaulus viviparus TaxID=29172 RepID=A0A0D8YBK9_DICVI|nr:triacylglycerol lipase [Dictyocaulus viviparus]
MPIENRHRRVTRRTLLTASTMQVIYLMTCLYLIYCRPFPQKHTNYDETTARRLLSLAAGAYASREQQEACLNRGMSSEEAYTILTTVVVQCDTMNNTCVGSHTKKHIVVVYRVHCISQHQLVAQGINTFTNFKDFFGMGKKFRGNASLKPIRGKASFNTPKKYMNSSNLLVFVSEKQILDYNITFTGHSLGGALAVLAAARTATQGYRNGDQITVYTFGQPRVGTAISQIFTIVSYGAICQKRMVVGSYRVVFRKDIVPHIPPCETYESWWYGEYYEDGTYCDVRAKIILIIIEQKSEPQGEDYSCSNGLTFSFDDWFDYINDHLHYFGVKISQYGEVSCDANMMNVEVSWLEKLVRMISVYIELK